MTEPVRDYLDAPERAAAHIVGGSSPLLPHARVRRRQKKLDGALVADNPTAIREAEAASLRRRKNRAKAVGKEDAQLDLVVALGTGLGAGAGDARRAPRCWGCCRRSRISRPGRLRERHHRFADGHGRDASSI